MVIPFFVNIFYIIFAFIYSGIIYKIIKSRLVQLLVFFLILILPFSDILIQKVIKSYYETFKKEAIIYDLPKKDDDRKTIKSEIIKNPKARYMINIQSQEKLFGLFYEIRYQLIDRQNKKVLVETISATFPYQKDNFRNKYLFWHIEKYDFFNISAINEKDIQEEDIIVKLLNAGYL